MEKVAISIELKVGEWRTMFFITRIRTIGYIFFDMITCTNNGF